MKVMTAYIICRLVACGDLDWDADVVISKASSIMEGTTAGLCEGERLTVLELLFGMSRTQCIILLFIHLKRYFLQQ